MILNCKNIYYFRST